MSDVLIQSEHEPLDDELKRFFERTADVLASIRDEVLRLIRETPEDAENKNLMRWAIMYAVVLRDIGRSAANLLSDGSHSRAALMLRRAMFEYRTRFRLFVIDPSQASTAMDEFHDLGRKFERRVPGQVTFIRDPNFKQDRYDAARRKYPNFSAICDAVYGGDAPEYYAHFYSYPGSLLHGDAMLSMDILKVDGDQEGVHVNSARPFTNQIGGNMLVFLLDFSGDVCRSLDLPSRRVVEVIGKEFNDRRRAIGLLED